MADSPSPASFRDQNREFWEERGKTTQTGHAVTMLAEHGRYGEYVHRAEMRFIDEFMPQEILPAVLDLGCGAGRLTLELAPRASSITGIELSASLVKIAKDAARARGLTNVRIDVGSVDQPPSSDKFDVVILSGVLNSVDDRTVQAALQNAARALRPGGVLLIRNNCANTAGFFRPAGPNQAPVQYRTGDDYLRAIREIQHLEVIAERYLFPPLCLPNLFYYYAVPKSLRNARAVTELLELWFRLEELTAARRLRMFGSIYRYFVRMIRKPTSFRVIAARRTPG